MEHPPTLDEFAITSQLDFVVPLKQIGLITRSVLEAIYLFHKPRRIIIVSAKIELILLASLCSNWQIGPIEFVDEETFFIPNFNIKFHELLSEYDRDRPGDQREPGWWIQQLIKLGAATQIPNISNMYVVWDGDLVPTRRWRLCSRAADGSIQYHIAILQGESRSEFNSTQYTHCMRALTGMTPIEPQEGGGTFVAHHMVFNKQYVEEMLALMTEKTESDLQWPRLIMSYSRKFFRFSEYKTYTTFMLKHHPGDFHYHPLPLFGEGGLRFRDANNITNEMLACCKIADGGLSYESVKQYFCTAWQASTLKLGPNMPAYVQLDHVYGLQGIDLNITAPAGGVPVLTVPAITAAGGACSDDQMMTLSPLDMSCDTTSGPVGCEEASLSTVGGPGSASACLPLHRQLHKVPSGSSLHLLVTKCCGSPVRTCSPYRPPAAAGSALTRQWTSPSLSSSSSSSSSSSCALVAHSQSFACEDDVSAPLPVKRSCAWGKAR